MKGLTLRKCGFGESLTKTSLVEAKNSKDILDGLKEKKDFVKAAGNELHGRTRLCG